MDLSAKTRLTRRVIQVWFQNCRARDRRKGRPIPERPGGTRPGRIPGGGGNMILSPPTMISSPPISSAFHSNSNQNNGLLGNGQLSILSDYYAMPGTTGVYTARSPGAISPDSPPSKSPRSPTVGTTALQNEPLDLSTKKTSENPQKTGAAKRENKSEDSEGDVDDALDLSCSSSQKQNEKDSQEGPGNSSKKLKLEENNNRNHHHHHHGDGTSGGGLVSMFVSPAYAAFRQQGAFLMSEGIQARRTTPSPGSEPGSASPVSLRTPFSPGSGINTIPAHSQQQSAARKGGCSPRSGIAGLLEVPRALSNCSSPRSNNNPLDSSFTSTTSVESMGSVAVEMVSSSRRPPFHHPAAALIEAVNGELVGQQQRKRKKSWKQVRTYLLFLTFSITGS